MSVSVKSNREIELMREAGKILGTVLNELSKEIKPGMTTHRIDQLGEELIRSLLADFETDPGKLWNTNIFGKSLNELVSEGVQAKLLHMPQEARSRLQTTLERIINEGCDGLICILL